jgi:DNA repair protein RadC
MRDTPGRERPRERLIEHGADRLSAEELLAVVISRGTSGTPVREIAQRLINEFGSISAIGNATIEQLKRVPGIGPAKACQLLAAFELARRNQAEQADSTRADLSSPDAVARVVRPMVVERQKECFFALLLDSRNRLIRTDRVSVGGLDATMAHPREVFDAAVRDHAAALVVVHNHPSGDPTPSDDDVRLTRRLAEAGKVLGIRLQDHVIITQDRHYSFRGHALI